MTRLTAEEDFALQSPATIAADILEGQRAAIWRPLAQKFGWEWSPAHDGYINERHSRHMGRSGWDGYYVAPDAEDACFQDGIETLDQALAALEAD